MKIYQNNKLIARFSRVSFCLMKGDKGDLVEVGERWVLEDAEKVLIDNIIIDSSIHTFDSKMLEAIFKEYKERLGLDKAKLMVIADNQEELEQQRIVLDIKE